MSDELTAAAGATPAAAPAASRPGTVQVGSRTFTIERPNGRKASTAFKLLKRVSGTVKAVTTELGAFEREYRRNHSIELDRVQARMRYPARPVMGPDPERPADPEAFTFLRDEAGALILRSALDSMTAEDWERSEHKLRLPSNPTMTERFGVIIEVAGEDAEEELYALVALFTFGNDEVKALKREGRLDDALAERGQELLDDGYLEELLELAVVIGEVIDDQFRRKIASMGDRAGNALRLFGIDLTKIRQATAEQAPQTTTQAPQTPSQPTDGPATSSSSSRPTSSSASPTPGDGGPTSPSTPTTPSSSPSPTVPTGSDT